MRNIPKGCLAILVGQEGEEQQKFVIPVIYINHPLFMQLLKEAEEEYGFDQKGPITLPCHVEEFRTVQGMIDQALIRTKTTSTEKRANGRPSHTHAFASRGERLHGEAR